MKKRLSALLAAALLLACLSGCGGAAPEATEPAPTQPALIEPLDDAYRNWYEVFVYSYADSNGDGIGDLKGLTGKLPYIHDLGFNGIWLMPIMPSPSYHKYDVTDYYNVDSQYGTLEDLRELLAQAHELGIRVIMDLPVNHSSDKHPWFLSAREGEESPYRDYYNWSETMRGGYSPAGGMYYESQFVSTMPDLNLDSQAVREEIAEIVAFWLGDVGLDGFRLDAVTSYYTGNIEKNVAFLTWLGDTAREVKPDCYIVGEAWTDLTSIGHYSQAGIDSFFTFPVAQQDGSIAKLLGNAAKTPGETYADVTLRLEDTLAPGSIPAPFLGNHDTARPANFLGRSNVDKLKMAAGLLAMLPGNPFVYYGEEIGMLGKGEDPNKRIGMLWDTEENTTTPPPGATETAYALPSVTEQLADENSLLNYYRHAMWLRHENPEIARGATRILESSTPDVCILARSWEGSTVYIAVNPSLNDHEIALPLTGLTLTGRLGGEAAVNEDTLTLPAYTIALLRQG